jgi:probable addiction module antidote protein
MAICLDACFEEADGNLAFIAKALGDIAYANGMSQVARDAGLSSESLYKALSCERSPDFDTILRVVNALGLKLHTEAKAIMRNSGSLPHIVPEVLRKAKSKSQSFLSPPNPTQRLSGRWVAPCPVSPRFFRPCRLVRALNTYLI